MLEEYSLFQNNMIERLDDRKWFIECMAFNFYSIGAEWGAFTETSARRLGETYDFWKVDARRTLDSGIKKGTKQLDHFKQASFIAFWLRRQIPINRTLRILPDGTVAVKLHLLSKHTSVVEPIANDERPYATHTTSTLEYIRGCSLKRDCVRDFAMVLKHKNMSPHALYLLYKSLFTNLRAASPRLES